MLWGTPRLGQCIDTRLAPCTAPKTSRQRRASLQSPTTARDLSRSPSPRQRRAPLQDTADGMRMLQLRRAESPPLTARSRREEAGMRESAVRGACLRGVVRGGWSPQQGWHVLER